MIVRLIHLWHHYDNYGIGSILSCKQLKLNLDILNIKIEH